MGNFRDAYKCSGKYAPSSIGALLVCLEGNSLLGILKEKICIFGFKFLDHEDNKNISDCKSGSLQRTGLH
jgi:hypothetical protein